MQTYATAVYTDLAALPGRYESLLSSAGRASFFHSLPWYLNFVRCVLAPGERVRIYAVDAAGSARAVLMMRSSASGGRLSGISNYYTSLFGPALDPAEPDVQGVLDALASAIARDEIRWDTVDLRPLATDAPAFPALVAALRKTGLAVQSYFCFGNWYLKVGARSYAEYFETLPSQLKNTVTRKRKQIEKLKSRIVVYRDAAGLEEGLKAYERIYAASWKVPEPYPDFIPGLCRTCAALGWLRLGVAYVDEQPVAAQIWIVAEGIAAIYKLAYDERHAKLSAGSILTAHLMQQAIDVDKVREVDYLTGDDSYKKDWMSDRRERWGVIAFNLRTPRGLLAAALNFGASAAKSALNAIRYHRTSRREDA
ncbi:MAG TPA: GNAT family N-acetyltransferase [Burkholderiales bacterium]|nr:GNAT family N-acetyltransferase [Burkholderiales bacterium]